MTNAMDDSYVGEVYSKGDYEKLGNCISLAIVFFEAADRHRAQGQKINAKMIVENLRNYGTVGDDSKTYKIQNKVTSLLAHVYNDVIRSEYFIRNERKPFERKAA